MNTPTKTVLFTAFEPSGDAHAATVIAELKNHNPDLSIKAWGGPLMAKAGADVIEYTVDNAAMGAGALAKIKEHWSINKRLKRWLKDNWVVVHVPVDSPAANFPICKLTKKAGCRIVHLVAPQIWAWGPWRINKLRKRTDKVLCLLPFEPDYFNTRNVNARFIGHPVMSRPLDLDTIKEQAGHMPHGSPKIAFLPGSRPSEINYHITSMTRIFAELKALNSNASGVIVAANEEIANAIHRKIDVLPVGLFVVAGRLDAALHWADIAIVCSGTATLDVARHRVPMIVMYRMNPLPWFAIARWVIRSEFFALPNLIAGREIVPEFVPLFGSDKPIIDAASSVLKDSRKQSTQIKAFDRIASFFEGYNPGTTAAKEILAMMPTEEPQQ